MISTLRLRDSSSRHDKLIPKGGERERERERARTPKKQEVQPRSVMGSTLSSTSTSLLNRLSTRPTGVQSKKPMLGARSTPASSAACSERAAASVPRYSASDDTDTDATACPTPRSLTVAERARAATTCHRSSRLLDNLDIFLNYLSRANYYLLGTIY